jgi:hypothetical protein
MSWWRESKIENFDDRNDVNGRIKQLTALAELLRYGAKLIYQTARGARAMVGQVADNKVMSSFPTITNILAEADTIAIDSPGKFAYLCKAAADILLHRVADLEVERDEWTHELNPQRVKGFVDDDDE